MITYLKIFFVDKTKPVILKNPVELNRFVVGTEVRPDGEEVYAPGRFDERKHIIDKKMIKKLVPMKMNNHYGILERELPYDE